MVVNHGELCCASGCESLLTHILGCNAHDTFCIRRFLNLLNKVLKSEAVVVDHVCYTEPNSCESCCVILSRLCLSYGVSCRAIGY